VLLLFCVFFSSAQTLEDKNPYSSRVIAKYYSNQELHYLENNKPEKFKKIKYYYLHSFIVTDLNCATCKKMNYDLIDVLDYNRYRSDNERVTIDNAEYGFSITLLSRREVDRMIKFDTVVLDNSSKE